MQARQAPPSTEATARLRKLGPSDLFVTGSGTRAIQIGKHHDGVSVGGNSQAGAGIDFLRKSESKGKIMNRYTLPDLSYDYSALEPHISGKIMELHHGKHHASYVKNANTVLDQLDEARQKEDFARLAALERALAFNLSGHILHSIFWKNLTPKGGGTPH